MDGKNLLQEELPKNVLSTYLEEDLHQIYLLTPYLDILQRWHNNIVFDK